MVPLTNPQFLTVHKISLTISDRWTPWNSMQWSMFTVLRIISKHTLQLLNLLNIKTSIFTAWFDAAVEFLTSSQWHTLLWIQTQAVRLGVCIARMQYGIPFMRISCSCAYRTCYTTRPPPPAGTWVSFIHALVLEFPLHENCKKCATVSVTEAISLSHMLLSIQ